MTRIVICQKRRNGKKIELIGLDIPQGISKRVTTYIYTIGGWYFKGRTNWFEVKSPSLDFAVKYIKSMGNEEDGYIEEVDVENVL